MLIAIYLQYKCFLFLTHSTKVWLPFLGGVGVCVEVSLRTACCCKNCDWWINMFYKLKYDVTVYDVPRAMMLPSQCYHHNVTIYEVQFTLIRFCRPPPIKQLLAKKINKKLIKKANITKGNKSSVNVNDIPSLFYPIPWDCNGEINNVFITRKRKESNNFILWFSMENIFS